MRCCRMRKLMFRVVFPFELKLRNTADDCGAVDDLYSLFAVVVHVGSGPNHGARAGFVIDGIPYHVLYIFVG